MICISLQPDALELLQLTGVCKTMVMFAMRRANGDWFALEEQGSLGIPVFRSSRDAMVARRRDAGMECFRPVALDEPAFKNLTTTDIGNATFWLVGDPLRKLSRARRLDLKEFKQFMSSGAEQHLKVE